jgi:hypothetical protein
MGAVVGRDQIDRSGKRAVDRGRRRKKGSRSVQWRGFRWNFPSPDLYALPLDVTVTFGNIQIFLFPKLPLSYSFSLLSSKSILHKIQCPFFYKECSAEIRTEQPIYIHLKKVKLLDVLL